jgi:transcriptional regulator with XRE-family HTH domain
MAESDIQAEELPLDSAGSRLRRTREAAGLSLGDIAARTKIAERHLSSIEQSRFEALASRTYAVGFARAYARAVGLDEAEIAQAVRDELAASDNVREQPKADVFEPGDPARVPGSRLAWAAALAAVVVIGFVFIYWRSFFSPAVSLPELTAEQTGEQTGAPAAAAKAAPVAAAAAQAVVFTALQPGVWVKFYDAAGNQLMQKQMALGESYTVPADASGPLIRTARPDALQITVGGRIVRRLADKPVSLKDVPVSAAALLARTAPTPPAAPAAPVAPAAPAPQTSASPRAAATPTPTPTPSPRPTAAAASPGPKPSPAAERRPPPSPTPAATPSPAPAALTAPAQPETSTVSN